MESKGVSLAVIVLGAIGIAVSALIMAGRNDPTTSIGLMIAGAILVGSGAIAGAIGGSK